MARATLIKCLLERARQAFVRTPRVGVNTPVFRGALDNRPKPASARTRVVVQQNGRVRRSGKMVRPAPMLVRGVVAAVLALAVASGLFGLRLSAQVPGPNINVLPVLTDQNGNPITPAQDPQAAFKGDYYLNRQVEVAIGASTRNPQHVAAFFNDYRAVDIQQDIGQGEQVIPINNLFARMWQSLGGVWAKLTGRGPRSAAHKGELPEEEEAASAFWAWIGGSRSSDGGQTWSGFMLPGAPFDNSVASVNSPVQGLLAATDPKAKWGPCGKLYVAFIAFTLEGNSKLAVARYEDVNPPTGEWLRYIDTVVVEEGKNDRNGHFHDLPDLAVDYRGANSADPCAHSVYVAWARFNGVDTNGKFHSIMNFARSTNQGQTYTVQKIDGNFTTSQGAAIAIDPRPGTPTTTGGGTVYVAWRTFGGPHSILVSKSTTFGATFQNQPTDILAPGQLQRFDQPTLSTDAVSPALIQPRSLAVPTITVTAAGTVFAGWQERVNISACPGTSCGQPQANGSPRIVVVKSTTQGATWTNLDGGAVSQRKAIDFADRDAPPGPTDPPLPAPGLGVLPQYRASGPQIQPKLTFGAGSLLLSYYESRGVLTGNDTYQLVDIGPNPGPPYTAGFISGIDRWMDFRNALLNPSTGALLGTSQVSRYPIKKDANLADGEGLNDVEAANPPCSPDSGAGLRPCVRKVNRVGVPTTEAGISPYIGDYHGASGPVDFVPTAQGWRFALDPSDVPYRGFRTAFTDMRNQVPPTYPPDKLEWQRYPYYMTPGSTGFAPGECNAGSRNADVLTAVTNADIIVGAPVNFKKLGEVEASFPFFVQNPTNVYRYFRLTITTGNAVSSLSQTENDDSDDVQVHPFSGITRVVYVSQTAPPSTIVKVMVQEITQSGDVVPNGLTGFVTFNGDQSNPVTASTETHTPTPTTPTPTTPTPTTPTPTTPTPTTATIYDQTSTTWTATNSGGTASAYTLSFHIDNAQAYQSNYVSQVLVWKNASNGTQKGCDALVLPHSQILVNVTNPTPTTPTPTTPTPTTPTPTTATFALAPSEPTGTAASTSDAIALAAATADDGTLKAPLPRDQVYITWRAFQTKRDCLPGETDTDACVSPKEKFRPDKDPPALTMQSQSCNRGNSTNCEIAYVGPDLVVSPSTPIAASGTIFKTFLDFPAASWTLLNQGTNGATAEDGAFVHRVYLSNNTKIDAGDVLLATAGTTTGTLAAGGTQLFPKTTVKLPPRTPPGSYFLCLSIDDDREVSELSVAREDNNVVCAPVIVQ